jgi:hypothetical protein
MVLRPSISLELNQAHGVGLQARLTALLIYSPPALLHFAVGTHTPGAPFLPVQGPFSSERRTPAKGLVAVERSVSDKRRRGRMVSCILGFRKLGVSSILILDLGNELRGKKSMSWTWDWKVRLHMYIAFTPPSLNSRQTGTALVCSTRTRPNDVPPLSFTLTIDMASGHH